MLNHKIHSVDGVTYLSVWEPHPELKKKPLYRVRYQVRSLEEVKLLLDAIAGRIIELPHDFLKRDV